MQKNVNKQQLDVDVGKIAEIVSQTPEYIQEKIDSWLLSKHYNGNSYVDLKLISMLSGLSTASISYFINNKKGSISPKNVNMLSKLVSALGYFPSIPAQKLRSNEKKSIAFISPFSESPSPEFYLEIFKGLKQEADKYGYMVDLYDVSENKEEAFFERLPFLGMIDGIIISSINLNNEMLDILEKQNLPVVNLHSWNQLERCPIISSLNPEIAAFKKLLDHLFDECKYESPIFVSLPIKTNISRIQKMNLFTDALQRYGIKGGIEGRVVFVDRYSISEGHRIFPDLERSGADVVICLSDMIAASIITEFNRRGRKIAVTGYDNLDIGKLFDITTVDQRMMETGRIAFQKLYNGIQCILNNGSFPDYEEIHMDFSFLKRSSSLVAKEKRE